MDIIQKVTTIVNEYTLVISITVMALLSGNRPHIGSFKDFSTSFVLAFTYTTATIALCQYVGVSYEVTIPVTLMIGRWSYIIDQKIITTFNRLDIVNFIDKVVGKSK